MSEGESERASGEREREREIKELPLWQLRAPPRPAPRPRFPLFFLDTMQAALRPATRPSPRLAPATSGRRVAAVAPLAAKPTKAADFRAMSDDDIKAAVAEGKTALFKLRMAQKTRQVRGGEGREEEGRGDGARRRRIGRGLAGWPPRACGPQSGGEGEGACRFGGGQGLQGTTPIAAAMGWPVAWLGARVVGGASQSVRGPARDGRHTRTATAAVGG